MEWYWVLIIILCSAIILVLLSLIFYKHFFKRFWDIVLSGMSLIVFLPLLFILTILGAIFMKGNPFYIQERPGKKDKNDKEKIFKLIKFRTMSNAKDEHGELLPDCERLNKYGKFLRGSSLDELPELINILLGDMSIVGPRPLLVRYLPRYSDEQRHRHDIRPGLTGYAQCHGRNAISWKEKFELDVWYVRNVSLFLDLSIIFKTVVSVFKKEGINASEDISSDEFTGD